jgi:uncharacterized protein (TIGR02001 family)
VFGLPNELGGTDMKRVTTGIAAGALMACASATAHAEFSGNVALTSDYLFRGISQTDENPAIQGGIDYSHDSGFYAGLWGSNVDFGEDTGDGLGSRASLELDLYAGFSRNPPGALGWDVGVIRYGYPGAGSRRNYDYTEIYGKLSYDFGVAAGTAGINYSNDYFAASGTGVYYYGEVAVPLPAEFKVGAHVGHQTIDKNDVFGTPDYTDWKIGVSKDFGGLGFALDYVDTDLSKSECFGGTNLCDSRVVFTLSKGL